MATQLLTPKFRILYPKLFTPEVNKLSGKTEYSLIAVFPKGTDKSKLEKAMTEAIVKKFGEDKKKWPKNIRSPFRACEEKEKEGQLPSGYEEGGFFMNIKSQVPSDPAKAASYKPPQVFDKTKTLMLDQSNMYGGCFCQALVNASAYSQAGNAGVSFYLDAVIKVADGKPVSTKLEASAVFQGVEIDDSEMGETDSSALFG